MAFNPGIPSTPKSPGLSRPSPSRHSRTSPELLVGSWRNQCPASTMEIMPCAGTLDNLIDMNGKLTLPPLASSASRLPTLLPGPSLIFTTHPHSAISDQSHTSYPNYVLRTRELVSDPHRSNRPGSSAHPAQHVFPFGSFGSELLSRSSPRHAAITHSSLRPKTSSSEFFNNISDLAAHYGIPQSLPRAPHPTPRRPPESDPESDPTLAVDNLLPDFDFASLCSNYLNMLSQKSDEGVYDGVPSDLPSTTSAPEVTDADAIQSLIHVLQATPDLQASSGLHEYLTSPLLDSPLDDDLLTTPAIDSADMNADILTSPLLGDYAGDSFGDFPSLFEDMGDTIYRQPKSQPDATVATEPSFADMYKMSPTTPFLEPPSSPAYDPTTGKSPGRRRTSATGTRKNLSPGSLVPVDAPTQPRKYMTPSATSRKSLPAVWARKRSRQTAFGDEDEQLKEETEKPTLSELEQIEAKRRQNTIAARRSRKRKLEYQRELEESAELHRQECEAWKNKAAMYLALLQSHGIPVPEIPP